MADMSHCQFCESASAAYTCPKCHAYYCSAGCYRHSDHSQCSEQFFKDQVLTEVGATSENDEALKKMVHILKRAHMDDEELEPCSDENEPDISDSWHQRFGKLNLNETDVGTLWNKLTIEEQQDFTAMLKDNRIHQFIPEWVPWWTRTDSLVQKHHLDVSEVEKTISDIPKLSQLLRDKNPSGLVCYNVLNVLYAYVVVCYLHNGDVHDLPIDAAKTMMDLSKNLGENWNFSSAAESVASVRERTLQLGFALKDSHFLTTTAKDLIYIINGPHPTTPSSEYSVTALVELRKLFQTAENEAQTNNMKQLQAECHKSEKKIKFNISWLREYAANLSETVPSLKLVEDSSKLSLLAVVKHDGSGVDVE